MSGIDKIQKRRQEDQNNQKGPGVELWLRDGDQAFASALSSGSQEDDPYLDSLYMHTFRNTGPQGQIVIRNAFCTKDEGTCQHCDQGDRAGHRFAFWAFVHYVLHLNKGKEEWKEVTQGASGAKRYREDINDFRVFVHGFGKNDYLWNQLTDIFSDQGALNKVVLRVKRSGGGMQDTSYAIVATNVPVDLSADSKEKAKALPPVKEYFRARYPNSSAQTKVVDLEKTESPASKTALGRIVDADDTNGEDDLF